MRVALLLLFTAVASQSAFGQSMQSAPCAESPIVRDAAPADPNADPVGPENWYINAERTLWAGPVPESGWSSGGTLYAGGTTVKGQKTYWVRPERAQLAISGRRLDAAAPPVEAHIPCCYTSGFQIVGLYFPTQGCWEITAKAGVGELRFVTLVKQ